MVNCRVLPVFRNTCSGISLIKDIKIRLEPCGAKVCPTLEIMPRVASGDCTLSIPLHDIMMFRSYVNALKEAINELSEFIGKGVLVGDELIVPAEWLERVAVSYECVMSAEDALRFLKDVVSLLEHIMPDGF